MKNLTFAFSFLLPIVVIAVGPSADEMALHKARRYGAEAMECLRVIDQDGCPVAGAKVWGGLQTGGNLNDFTAISGYTNTNGEYVIEGKCTNRIRCDITKVGYYPSELCLSNYAYSHSVSNGVWIPYGEMRVVTLKKIKRPGQLYAFPDSLRSCKIPEFNKWLGFDLECCDWTSPAGRGRHADVLLRFSSFRKSLCDYKYIMDVSFTNNPYAGVYLMKEDKSSKLTTVYEADTNATYRVSFRTIKEQTPGNSRQWDFLDSDSYLVFRTRTRTDKQGNLVGSHYGKIMGRWVSGKEFMILSDGCFNPIENDTNIEDGTSLRAVLRNLNKKQ